MAAIKSTTRSKYETIEVGAVEVLADVSLLAKADSLFFNATTIAKQFDKDVRDFLKLDGTSEYVSCMVKDSNCGINTQLDCMIPRRGKYGGTWLHQNLALRFARWCSVSFEYQLDKWIGQRMDNERQRKLARDDVRDGCDMWQVQMLEKVQRINASLIECGMPFNDRKEKLQQVIDRDGLPANCDQVLRVAA